MMKYNKINNQTSIYGCLIENPLMNIYRNNYEIKRRNRLDFTRIANISIPHPYRRRFCVRLSRNRYRLLRDYLGLRLEV